MLCLTPYLTSSIRCVVSINTLNLNYLFQVYIWCSHSCKLDYPPTFHFSKWLHHSLLKTANYWHHLCLLSPSHLTSNVLFTSKIYSIPPLFSISSTSLGQATIISPADEMQQLTSGSPYCCSHPPSHNLLSRQQSKWVFKRCKSDHVTPLLTTFWRFPIILKIKPKLLIAV